MEPGRNRCYDPLPKDPPKACRYDYGEYLSSRMNNGKWFVVFRDLLPHLTSRQIIVLSSLLNFGRVAPATDGWFLCTTRLAEDLTGLNPVQLDQVLEDLADQGLVEVENRGSSRFVRINTDALDKLVDA